jgi:putative transposase
LGDDPASRQAAYRELFRYQLDPGVVNEIRQVANTGFALGNERFFEKKCHSP